MYFVEKIVFLFRDSSTQSRYLLITSFKMSSGNRLLIDAYVNTIGTMYYFISTGVSENRNTCPRIVFVLWTFRNLTEVTPYEDSAPSLKAASDPRDLITLISLRAKPIYFWFRDNI